VKAHLDLKRWAFVCRLWEGEGIVMRVGILETFDAAHRHAGGSGVHGHTYEVEVEVESPLDKGMVVDFRVLKQRARQALEAFDHKDLGPMLKDTSCAGVCRAVFKALSKAQTGVHRVRVREGKDGWAETKGPKKKK
jgi:6-pyruvoyltetrahydropterin/6-carboxytetrahydropterin synthase